MNRLLDSAVSAFREGERISAWMAERAAPLLVELAERTAARLAVGGRVILFGNGGSAADAQHLAAELIGRFRVERRPLPAIALTTNTSVLTSLANDYGFERVFARQVEALATAEDVVIAISTSGKSPNVLLGVDEARTRGCVTVGFTGDPGTPLAEAVDFCLSVPSSDVARIQEAHIAAGHVLCLLIERLCVRSGPSDLPGDGIK